MTIEVESVEPGKYFSSEHTSGSTVNVTLSRDELDDNGKETGKREYVSCEGILIWEEDDENMEDIFDEWVEYAEEGEEGYKHWVE